MPSFSKKFIGVTLPIRLGQTGMFQQSIDIIEQTRSNVKNLILTKKGERLNQPRLGCDLWRILFDQLTPETIQRARISVVEAFREFLPYLEVVNFTVNQALPDENLLTVNVTYRFLNNPSVVDAVQFTTSTISQVNATTSLLSTGSAAFNITARATGSTGQVIRSGVRGTRVIPPGSLD